MQERIGTPHKKRRGRHIPKRTCVGCRQVLSKRSLIRIVRTSQGVIVDPTGKAPGRGAYLHEKRSCWQTALRGPLERALKTELSNEEGMLLEAHMQDLK